MEVKEQQVEKLRELVLERVDYTKEVSDKEIYRVIDDVLTTQKLFYCSISMRLRLRRELFFSLRKLGVLQELLDDPKITEIMINGTEGIYLEKAGRLTEWRQRFSSRKKLEDVIQQIVGRNNRVVNEANPIVDTRLDNGARVHIVLAPVAINGPIVTIRRFPDQPVTMQDLIGWGSITEEAAAFLRKLVIAGYNIFVSGGTGSGKTTFLNVLSEFIPKEERVVTIEDSAELQLQGLPNLVRLETRESNGESTARITIRDLIRASLRMRPDRIIVGEVRGAEAVDMLQAMNTGHSGSLSTGHANSPKDMLNRLETMVLMGMEIPLSAVRRQIASGIDILVHLGRLRDKSRRVLEIAEIAGCGEQGISLRSLYRFEEETLSGREKVQGCLKKKQPLLNTEKLFRAGLGEADEKEKKNADNQCN